MAGASPLVTSPSSVHRAVWDVRSQRMDSGSTVASGYGVPSARWITVVSLTAYPGASKPSSVKGSSTV